MKKIKQKINLDNKIENKNFKIIQFVKLSGVREKEKFDQNRIISPIFGRAVLDESVSEYMMSDMGALDKRYDAFRDDKNKMLDEKELIEKYGSKYYEFTDIITNKHREIYLGGKTHKPYVEEKEIKKTVTPNKSRIKPIIKTNTILPVDEPIYYDDKKLNIDDMENIDIKINNNFDKNIEEVEEITNIDPIINDNIEEIKDIEIDEEDIVKEEELSIIADEVVNKPIILTKIEEEKEIKVSNPTNKFTKTTDNTINNTVKYDDTTSSYYVPFSFFKKDEANLSNHPEWISHHIEKINNTLEEFNIDGRVKGYKFGPSVTRYEIELGSGINVRAINSIEANLKMTLEVQSLKIESPIPGKPYVGIEVPNKTRQTVYFGSVINSPEFNKEKNSLKVALGQDVDGNKVIVDITEMPHGLVAGATNSGKSVCINTFIMSLILLNSPTDLRLILIDPKMVELIPYSQLPHLATPVITNEIDASNALQWAVDETERRYKKMGENSSKNIDIFNKLVEDNKISEQKMPRIVIIIDELADLMMKTSQDVEDSIQKITQKSRAAGVYIIVATQRPTTDVIKGTIKANITTRIAFKVASYTDSTTILGQSGAENLLGSGDMLYSKTENVKRIQGAFIQDSEITSVISYICQRYSIPYLFDNNRNRKPKLKQQIQQKDELYEDIARYIVSNNNSSNNNICNTFNIGFNRAYSIFEMLVKDGIVTDSKGTTKRDILVNMEELEKILRSNNG